jgi:anti-sigma regulatory factor (Ser/Thr protein kinase)
MTPQSWESDGGRRAALSMETRRFPNTPGSVTSARRFVQERLDGAPRDVADAVTVMTSELATNSIRHAETAFEVGIDRTPGAIRVEVTDGGDGEPVVRAPEPTAPSGRGLYIVEQLSDDWGIRPAPGGAAKTVWFTVSLAHH